MRRLFRRPTALRVTVRSEAAVEQMRARAAEAGIALPS